MYAPEVSPKPLTQTIQSNGPKNQSHALRGATIAFQLTPSAPSVQVSSASAGARFAAYAAGTHSQQTPATRSSTREDGWQTTRLPRGRQPQTISDLVASAARLAASSNVNNPPPRPPVGVIRSSSAIAARHASVNTRSPRQSPTRSPKVKTYYEVNEVDKIGRISSREALSGAIASLASSAQSEEELPALQQNKILNFERIPTLTPCNLETASVHSAPSPGLAAAKGAIQASLSAKESPNLVPVYRSRPVVNLERAHTVSVGTLQRSKFSTTSSSMTIHIPGVSNVDSARHEPVPIKTPRPHLPFRSTLSNHSPSHTYSDDHEAAITVARLADAMVASSLASSRVSSRVTSPSRRIRNDPTRRRSRSFSALQDMSIASENPHPHLGMKPRHPMKQTLRKPVSDDDHEIELKKRGRRHWMRKHPNMHHEGDRKRWRDKVTELERRRYEGVFAANRGLLIGDGNFEPSPSNVWDNNFEGNQVVNVVVRDVWERSRLPRDILKEIYDLVSPEEDQALNREQFVVGLWLIDQRLKGRKLPAKVSASVWSSVRHTQGIRIRSQHYS